MSSGENHWHSRISSIVHELKPSGIRQFFDIVAQRRDAISLGVGEPDFVSPDPIIDAAIDALRNGYTHYTGNQGLLSLRQEISKYLGQEYGLQYNPETEILITVGVSQGVDLAFRSLMNPGDAVIYSQPSYVSYDPMIRLAGGTAIPAYSEFENNFELTVENIESVYTPNAKILFLNYPSNPTGAGMSRDRLDALARFATDKNLVVISDEIYADLTYEGKHVSFATLPEMFDRTILLGGFSKNFAMTGWRVGYAAGPAPAISAMTKIHQFSMLCAPTVSQIAAEAALKYALPERDRMKDAYRARRDFVVKKLNAIGLDTFMPGGAFYVFPQLTGLNMSSMQFAEGLLEEKNVAVVPGNAFGTQYDNFFRASYATSMNDLAIALDRMEDHLNKIR